MRLNISVGIIAAIALLTPACGGSGGGGGGPLGGLEAEATADSLSADDLGAMCSSMGSKAATAIPNTSDFGTVSLAEPLCVLFAVIGFGDESAGASTVAECNAFVTLCKEELAEEQEDGRGFGDLPTPAQASAEVNEDCLADDWSSCTATIDEITGCVDDAVASAKLSFAGQKDALNDLQALTCTTAINSTPEELDSLQTGATGENSAGPGPVASCQALLATCDNDIIATFSDIGSDDDEGDEFGDEEEWNGIPETSEQSCCDGQPAPFCEELACVECVCGEDSFCCEDAWDGLCAQKAQNTCADVCTCE